MDKFSQSSISSNIMRLIYKYDKPFNAVLRDLNKLNEEPDILDPILALEEYYNEQKWKYERN